jgi:hypothetical protein
MAGWQVKLAPQCLWVETSLRARRGDAEIAYVLAELLAAFCIRLSRMVDAQQIDLNLSLAPTHPL